MRFTFVLLILSVVVSALFAGSVYAIWTGLALFLGGVPAPSLHACLLFGVGGYGACFGFLLVVFLAETVIYALRRK